MDGGFIIKIYNNVPIVIEKYPLNEIIRRQAIWAIRHPNKRVPNSSWMDMLNLNLIGDARW